MAYETKILKLLHGTLSVAIPYQKYIAPHKSYFGYTKLPGAMLKDVLDSLSEQDIMTLQEDWVSVAAGVHAGITINEARGIGIPEFEGGYKRR